MASITFGSGFAVDQTWTVPVGVVSVQVDAYGAKGGGASGYRKGDYVVATLPVTGGETLTIKCGTTIPSGAGGWPGGGAPGASNSTGGGGGRSQVTGLSGAVYAAGGGGGGGYTVQAWTSGRSTGTTDGGDATLSSGGGGGSGLMGGYGAAGSHGSASGQSAVTGSAALISTSLNNFDYAGQVTLTWEVTTYPAAGMADAVSGAFCSAAVAGGAATYPAAGMAAAVSGAFAGASIGRPAAGMAAAVSAAFCDATVTAPVGDIVAFAYTGADQTWTVPAGVYEIMVECFGAGGPGFAHDGATRVGGKGGWIKATMPVTPGTVLTVKVGGAGGESVQNYDTPGGWPGGGKGVPYRTKHSDTNESGTGWSGAGGGGRTEIYYDTDRVVAGGGGGAGAYSDAFAFDATKLAASSNGDDGIDTGGQCGGCGGGLLGGSAAFSGSAGGGRPGSTGVAGAAALISSTNGTQTGNGSIIIRTYTRVGFDGGVKLAGESGFGVGLSLPSQAGIKLTGESAASVGARPPSDALVALSGETGYALVGSTEAEGLIHLVGESRALPDFAFHSGTYGAVLSAPWQAELLQQWATVLTADRWGAADVSAQWAAEPARTLWTATVGGAI